MARFSANGVIRSPRFTQPTHQPTPAPGAAAPQPWEPREEQEKQAREQRAEQGHEPHHGRHAEDRSRPSSFTRKTH
jgi:hypothetical protein